MNNKSGILIAIGIVDGGYTTWGQWSQCNEKCGGGTQTRRRYCTNPIPQHNGNQCAGNDTSEQACNTHQCPSKISLIHLFSQALYCTC